MSVAEILHDYAANLKFEDFPAPMVEQTKRINIYTMSGCLVDSRSFLSYFLNNGCKSLLILIVYNIEQAQIVSAMSDGGEPCILF